MSDTWTEQDAEHLRNLTECSDPQWIGEVASRAEAEMTRLRVQRDEARKMRNELIAMFFARRPVVSPPGLRGTAE